MNNVEMQGYKRVNKVQARQAYANDITIRVVPCKRIPTDQWTKLDWNRKDYEEKNMPEGTRVLSDWAFNNHCTAWTYYNGNYEVGYYPAFYIKMEA